MAALKNHFYILSQKNVKGENNLWKIKKGGVYLLTL
jgi:hypothetical protein